MAKGGKREGAGHPTNDFKNKCREALKAGKGVEFAQSILEGKKQPKTVSDFGKPKDIMVYPSIMDRMEALKWLADRAEGKPAQSVEVKGDPDSPLIVEKSKGGMEEFLSKALLRGL